MGRIRFIVGAATVTLALSLVAVEAKAITLPDTTSPCYTGSPDGCLKITNTDSEEYSSPAIYAVTQSMFGTAVVAHGDYIGTDSSSGNIGVSASGGNIGVYAEGVYGFYGYSSQSTGYGVYATNTSASGTGIFGTGFFGVVGQAPDLGDGIGVKGIGPNTYGVWGVSTAGSGVYGQSTTGPAVNASSQSGYGVSAASQSGIGLYATTATGGNPAVKGVGAVTGVHGIGSVQGVFGQATALTTTAYGLSGTSQNGSGVFGTSSSGFGVTGQSDFGTGVKATSSSPTAPALLAQSLVQPGIGVLAQATSTGTAVRGENTNTNGWAGYFDGKVYSTATFSTASWTSSDARLKKDVAELRYNLKDLAALRPVTFAWKDPARPGGRQLGFIAQDVQKVVPEVVQKDPTSGMLSVNYPALVPVLVKSVQEQQAIIARQEERMARQDARIAALEQRPVLSSMFSGGINVSVAIGAFAAMALAVIRRRKERGQAGA